MVRLAALVAVAVLPALSVAQLGALQDAGNNALRKLLATVFRFNDTQVDRVMVTKSGREPHPYAVDLNDENWEVLLRTGTHNPLAEPLPEDTVWCISVYGKDQVSNLFMTAADDTATHNSSEAGGTLPKHMRFARINYGTETVLPTRLWLWKVPVMVIATNNFQDLRFFKIGQIAPFHGPMSALLENEEHWKSMPVWRGSFAPGGSRAWMLEPISNAWATYHKYMSKIPSFVLLMVSGMMMNFVVGFFHKGQDKPATAPPVLDGDERKTQIRARLAELRADAAARAAAVTVEEEVVKASESVPQVEGATAVKKGTASKRK